MNARAFKTWFAVAALWLCAAFAAVPAAAQNRASIDRDRVALDDTLTMTIELVDEGLLDLPDFHQFLADFHIEDMRTDQQILMGNGGFGLKMILTLRLRPMRQGTIDIPPFRVGNQTFGPFRITVLPPRNAQPPAPVPVPVPQGQGAAPAMLQTSIDPGPVYVQQAIGYVVRLYFDQTRLIDGKLEQPAPQGATLGQVGDDVESNLEIDGRPYRLVERRYLLVPDRPGPLRVPSPVFEGQGVQSVFDEVFGNGRGRSTLKIAGESRSVQVRPIPTDAPQPWLPARSVSLRYLAAERSPRVGEAAKVVVEMTVDGANAAMLPELQLGVVGDAQVFPEPQQVDENFFDDRPRTVVVREFSVVPGKTGKLRAVGPRVAWWDVKQGVARTASLPDFMWQVAPAANATGAAAPAGEPAAASAGGERSDRRSLARFDRETLGIAAISILALLWAATLWWAWRLWKARRGARANANAPSAAPVARGYDAFAYKRLLENGSLAEIADALCAMATPTAKDLDRLRAMLDDPAQRAAIDALQRARWRDDSAAEARAQLRAAFAAGPRWRPQRNASTPALLPPLYPET